MLLSSLQCKSIKSFKAIICKSVLKRPLNRNIAMVYWQDQFFPFSFSVTQSKLQTTASLALKKSPSAALQQVYTQWDVCSFLCSVDSPKAWAWQRVAQSPHCRKCFADSVCGEARPCSWSPAGTELLFNPEQRCPVQTLWRNKNKLTSLHVQRSSFQMYVNSVWKSLTSSFWFWFLSTN